MGFDLYFTFVATSAVLIAIPGPNVGLIVSNSLRFGRRPGFWTVVGTTAGIAGQLGIVCLGMTSLLSLLAGWFQWIRWAGVAYLIFLGVRQILASADTSEVSEMWPRGRRWAVQGLFIALSNPKTILFFAAFLPQFVHPGRSAGIQLLGLSGTFVLMAFILDSIYALLAGRIHSMVDGRNQRVRLRKLSGTILIGAGAWLGLARVERG